MLIEFRVENHRSLRREQALTFETGFHGDQDDTRPRQVSGHNGLLLPVIVIYGPNASGKSNVLSALSFMRESVLLSQRRWEPEGGIPRTSFAWSGMKSETSLYEVTFVHEGAKYQYGFSVSDKVVEEEWLYAWPNGRQQMWFTREREDIRFGDNLKGPNEAVREITRANALFLSAAAQCGHSQLTSLFSWFRNIFAFNVETRSMGPFLPGVPAGLFFESEDRNFFSSDELNDSMVDRIRLLLRSADIGIVDIKRVTTDREMNGRIYRRRRILFQHSSADGDSWLDFEDESHGTKTIFRMAPSILGALETGGLLIVDELEANLHPLVGLCIIRLFNCPTSNPRNAQLLFTTHDTNLLGTTLGDPPLRRDQVWFTEKDKEGATTLYPLTDFHPRKSENLERGYLQGRYGAIPFLGKFGWESE